MFGNQIFEKQFFSVFSFLSATAKIVSGIWFPTKLLPQHGTLPTPSKKGDSTPQARSTQRFHLACQFGLTGCGAAWRAEQSRDLRLS